MFLVMMRLIAKIRKMKQLNRIQSVLFMIGGVLMVVGACCFAIMWQQDVMSWVYLAGALLFASIQIMQSYEGNSLTVKRLKKIMTLADVLFVVAGLLMVDMVYGLFRPMFDNQESYISYLYNKWVVVLLIAAMLEMYTMHRIDYVLSKEKKHQ